MKILFLVPYPITQAPSQRFRFEQYFKKLKERGFEIVVQSFLDSQNWQVFSISGQAFEKMIALCQGFAKRFLILSTITNYDFVFIHREAAPIGPPWIEWIIAKVFRARIIYDFDDAIWITDRSHETPALRWTKYRSKVAAICKWSYKVSCGNEYLAAFASLHQPNTIVNPTTIDLGYHEKKLSQSAGDNVVIGWTGSYSTIKYLAKIESVLQQIEAEFPFVTFHIIADKPPNLVLDRMQFTQWKKETEIEDLREFDIGIMPLPDDEWSKGKCGFKLLQYFAIGIPAIASPVGVNSRIIADGISGFLCDTHGEWIEALRKLILDADLRETFGKKGRETIERHYSVEANADNFFSLFEK